MFTVRTKNLLVDLCSFVEHTMQEAEPVLPTIDDVVSQTTTIDYSAFEKAAAHVAIVDNPKNYERKKARFEYIAQKQRDKRKKKDDEEKQMKQQKKKEKAELLATLTPEELKAYKDKEHERFNQIVGDRRVKKQQRKDVMKQIYQDGPSKHIAVIIDCAFNHLQTEAEINSLGQQLMLCYAANTKNPENPFYLSLTGINGALETKMNTFGGFPQQWLCHISDKHFTEAFPEEYKQQNIVYLSPDSDNVITEFQQGYMYVIGGIVDKNRYSANLLEFSYIFNRHKNLSMTQCKKYGLKHAKLPIQDHVKLIMSGILTVNQVFDIIKLQTQCNDWKHTLTTVIPQRKRKELENNATTTETTTTTTTTTNENLVVS